MSTAVTIVLVGVALILTNAATWKLSKSWTLMTRNRRDRKSTAAQLRILRKIVRQQMRAVVLAAAGVAAFGLLAIVLAGTVTR